MKFSHLSKKEGHGNYVHFIPYVNCPELLLKSVLSTIQNAKNGLGVIIDNRSDKSVKCPFEVIMETEAVNYFSIAKPCEPLNNPQTMNFMLKSAEELGKDFFTYINSDAEIKGDSMRLINYVNEIPKSSNWGIVITKYDFYSAFNIEACKIIGEWDFSRFPNHFFDNDYYYRLTESGFSILNIGGEDVINNSATNKNEYSLLNARINEMLYKIFYI
jgi:hypothetical protein